VGGLALGQLQGALAMCSRPHRHPLGRIDAADDDYLDEFFPLEPSRLAVLWWLAW
jgi:hypothetical protein